MTLSSTPAVVPDLLRLLAVPVFAWAAIRDVRTRRISSTVWVPLSILGVVALVWDGWAAWNVGGDVWALDFLLPAAISLGFVVPIAYLFWWFGGFGGADAKALMVLAVLFPTFPRYAVAGLEFPATTTPIGAFSFTILTNAVLVGLAVPLVLAVRNAAAGRIAPVMFVGWPVSVEEVPTTHGKVLETPDGLSRGGLDLDALRMYLRWRGLTLAEVREDPDRYRDPTTLPEEPNPPTDGAVAAEGIIPDGGTVDDPWGAHAFLEDIEGSAYGTTPEDLREGLEVLCANGTVWITPGTPFLVPIFFGLVIALVYGDLLFGVVF